MHACMHAYILRVPHIQVDPLGRDSVGYAHVRENLSLVFAPQVVDPLRLRLAVCVCVCVHACVRVEPTLCEPVMCAPGGGLSL